MENVLSERNGTSEESLNGGQKLMYSCITSDFYSTQLTTPKEKKWLNKRKEAKIVRYSLLLAKRVFNFSVFNLKFLLVLVSCFRVYPGSK